MFKKTSGELFYGWKVVFAFLIINTFVSGLSFYNHAVILNALSMQPQFTVQSVSLAVSLFFLSGGFTGLWVAKLLQDFDPRICICVGAIVAGCALSALALVETLWQLYSLYVLFGMGFCASGLIPATTLVTRWFQKKRAMALSIASTGLSLGGVLITPFCAMLVESAGLVAAAPIMGAVYIIGIVPIALLWVRPNPESMGLLADGEMALSESKGSSGNDLTDKSSDSVDRKAENRLQEKIVLSQGIELRDAIKGRIFWAISISYIFLMLAQVGGIAHQYGLIREVISDSETVMIVAILPVASIVGRLIGGWVIGQMSIRYFAIIMMLLQGLSLGLLSLNSNIVTLCIGLAVFGVTVGNLLMLQPLLIAEAFGIKEYPRIFSMASLLSSFGTASGPAILGLVYAASQNQYQIAYLVAAIAGIFGLVLFASGGEIRKHVG